MRFLSLGDSYTIGEGVPASERWPVQLAALLAKRGVSIDPPEMIARTGWTSDELAAAIGRQRLRGPYDLVSLWIGVNDQYRGRSVTGYRGRFRTLLGRAIELSGGEPGRALVLSIPDWGVTPFAAGRDPAGFARQIDGFNAVNRAETLRLGARYLDITPLSRKAARDRSLLASDGLHPSGRMYALWAALALPVALTALGRRPR